VQLVAATAVTESLECAPTCTPRGSGCAVVSTSTEWNLPDVLPSAPQRGRAAAVQRGAARRRRCSAHLHGAASGRLLRRAWMCLQEKTRCRCAASCSRCASLPQTAPILIVCGGAAQRQAGIVFAGEEALPQWRQLLEVRFFAAHFVAKQSGAQGRIAALWTFCWRGSPAEGGAHPLLLLPAVAAVTVPWHPCKPHKVCRCSLLTQCRGRAAASAPSSSTSVAEQLKSI